MTEADPWWTEVVLLGKDVFGPLVYEAGPSAWADPAHGGRSSYRVVLLLLESVPPPAIHGEPAKRTNGRLFFHTASRAVYVVQALPELLQSLRTSGREMAARLRRSESRR